MLFQVEFHAVVGAERDRFTIAEVTTGIHDKLVRRHPHVFADVEADDPETVVANWDRIKRAEKQRTSVFDGVARSLPALALADQLMRKAAKVGFDWPDVDGPLAKLDEELTELRAAADAEARSEELGDVLLSIVSIARHLDIDPELALRSAATKFQRRFEAVERSAVERGVELGDTDLPTLDGMWNEVKEAET